MSVYSALPGGFTPQLLRGLAREAGSQPIGPQDDVTYAGNGLVVLHALRDGAKTIRWSGRYDVIDLTSNRRLAQAVEQFTFTAHACETRWPFLASSEENK